MKQYKILQGFLPTYIQIFAVINLIRSSLLRLFSLHRHLGALATLPLAGARVQFFTSAKQKDTIRCPFVLAEKERFELSRRLFPTYTLSRGASSANLSTSPCTLRAAFAELALDIIHYLLSFVNSFLVFLFFIF